MGTEADRLYAAFFLLKDREEVRSFLEDILSDKELQRLKDRWRAWEMLRQGLSQTDVSQQTDLSRVTVGRADKVLRDGTGMLKTVLQRLDADI